MAAFTQAGAWNSSSILAGYGLMSTVGPLEPTKADIKRLNSRSGGEIRGFGNWMQSFNPGPIIKSGGPDKIYDYGKKVPVVVQARMPGLESRKISKFKGFKTPKPSTKIGRDIEGSQSVPVIGPIVGEKKVEEKKVEEKKVEEKKEDIFEKNADTDMAPLSPKDPEAPPQTPITPVEARFVPHVRAAPPIPERVVPQPNIGPNPTKHLSSTSSTEDKQIINLLPPPPQPWKMGPRKPRERRIAKRGPTLGRINTTKKIKTFDKADVEIADVNMQ